MVSRGSQSFEQVIGDSTVLLFLHSAIKVDLSQVLAKCEGSTGREKTIPLYNLICCNNNITKLLRHCVGYFCFANKV